MAMTEADRILYRLDQERQDLNLLFKNDLTLLDHEYFNKVMYSLSYAQELISDAREEYDARVAQLRKDIRADMNPE